EHLCGIGECRTGRIAFLGGSGGRQQRQQKRSHRTTDRSQAPSVLHHAHGTSEERGVAEHTGCISEGFFRGSPLPVLAKLRQGTPQLKQGGGRGERPLPFANPYVCSTLPDALSRGSTDRATAIR